MATETTHRVRTTWPIVYGTRARMSSGSGTGVAWALFLILGIPFALMAVLTILARAGLYLEALRPLWQPWPPDLLKPFLGVAVFAATLAYLAYRVGHRRGLRIGAGASLSTARRWTESGSMPFAVSQQALPLPPPPPPDEPY